MPVGKIVCVGRNYAAHAAELGNERPAEPLLFLKPPTALLAGGGIVTLPAWSAEVHYEVELVVRIGADGGGANLAAAAAGKAVDAYAVGIDFTARDVQAAAKKKGHPWAVAKGWDGSAPISELVPLDLVDRLKDVSITLDVNGDRRQDGRTRDMLWSVVELLQYVSSRFSLEPGDLVFTGTPAGVGPVNSGDRIAAETAAARLEVACVR